MRKIDFSISTTEMTTGSAIFFARSSSDLRCLYSLSGIVALKDYVREKQFIRAVSERKGRTGQDAKGQRCVSGLLVSGAFSREFLACRLGSLRYSRLGHLRYD